MTTQDLINTLRQGKPMTDKLMREIVRELEEKAEQLRTMGTALRAKDADYAALKAAAVHIYNSGYHAGHHDTVEGRYVDIHPSDMDSYHAEEVAELLADLCGEG